MEYGKRWTAKAPLELSDEERETLSRWARRAKSSQALATRSKIVLGGAEGLSNVEVGARGGAASGSNGWRSWSMVPGPADLPASPVNRLRMRCDAGIDAEECHALVPAKMAERSGLSKSTIGRICKSFELKPYRADRFKLSNDPFFLERSMTS